MKGKKNENGVDARTSAVQRHGWLKRMGLYSLIYGLGLATAWVIVLFQGLNQPMSSASSSGNGSALAAKQDPAKSPAAGKHGDKAEDPARGEAKHESHPDPLAELERINAINRANAERMGRPFKSPSVPRPQPVPPGVPAPPGDVP